SPRANTQLAAQRSFQTSPPRFPAAPSMAPAASNARDDTTDRTPHTLPCTAGSPDESATDRSSHAASTGAANPVDRRRGTPPIRRPPASLPADGEVLQAPGSEPYSLRVPGPTPANRFHPRRPTPEPRPTSPRSNTPASRTARPPRPTSARPAATSRR